MPLPFACERRVLSALYTLIKLIRRRSQRGPGGRPQRQWKNSKNLHSRFSYATGANIYM